MHAPLGDVLRALSAGKKGAGERLHHEVVGPHRCRRGAPTSLTLCEQLCGFRSFAHATKCQLFTLPWGIPREAQIGPTPDSSRLGALRRGVKHSRQVSYSPLFAPNATRTP